MKQTHTFQIIEIIFELFSKENEKGRSEEGSRRASHVARIHRFFEKTIAHGQIRQCGRLRIHVPVRPDLSSAYGRSGAQVYLLLTLLLYPTIAARPPLHGGEAEREQRDRVLKHRQHRPARKRIESKIGQPRANRLIAEFSSRQFHPSTSWESVRSLESRATRDFSPPRMDARVAPSFAKIWPSDKLVRGRISWPPLRYSNAIFLLFFTWWWFVTMGVGFRGILLLEIFELKYGCWVLFRNEIFFNRFLGRRGGFVFMALWNIGKY